MDEIDAEVAENYRELVASGAATWLSVVQTAEQMGSPALATWAAAQARAEAGAGAPEPKPRAKRTAAE